MPALPAPPLPPPRPALNPRQGFERSVPSYYGALTSSPHPGIVAGIVLGCIAAYLLVIWLIYTLLNIGPRAAGGRSMAASTYLGGESVITLSTRRSTVVGGGRRRRSSGAPARTRERVEVRTRSGAGSRRGAPLPFIVDAEPAESESDVFMGGGRSSVGGARGPMGRRGVRTVSTLSDDDDSGDSYESEDDEIVVVEEPRRGGRGSRYGERRDSRRRDY